MDGAAVNNCSIRLCFAVVCSNQLNDSCRPVHTRHNWNAHFIRYGTMCIKYALFPSTLLKKQVDLSNLRGVSIT